MPEIELTEPQDDFFDLDCRFPLFCGGYGSGKTEAKLLKALAEKFEEPESHIALYDPTYDLARLNTVPRLLHILDQMPVNYHYDKQANIVNIDNYGKFIIRTLENPARIVGYEVWRSHVDEFDTLKPDNAEDAWNKIIARNRQRIKSGADNRVSVYTTPEGFRFCYNRWILKGGEDYQIVQAPTRSNPHLPEGYIESLKRTYPENLLSAYLEGQFVNLTSGTVYRNYDRQAHDSKEQIKKNETLYIGMDFNVGKMAASVFVERANGYHAVAELKDMFDTPDMAQLIKERWQDKGHRIIVYPDASGGSRKSVDASRSDLAILRQFGFTVRAKKKNPPVKDRIAAVNKAFEDGKLWINVQACPTIADCLEQQAYDKNGEPDKTSGHDHQNDATSYFAFYEMPVNKPVLVTGIRSTM